MNDKKLTDNEVFNTVDACVNRNIKCNECPFIDEVGDGKDCVDISWGYLLAIINRQKAEISELQHKNSELEAELDDLKRDDLPRCKDALRRANEIGMALEKENKELKEENDRWKDVMETVAKCASESRKIAAKHARDEAIKEFAERVKNEYFCTGTGYEDAYVCKFIDNLVKEMVGEDNENL